MTAAILLVEDDPTARMLLADGLGEAGYQVTQAASGEAALSLLEQQQFDVVVTDINMRRVDGLQVLAAARRQPGQPAVIMLTGYGSLETSIAALRGGAHDYLLKPCTPPDLLRSVAGALRRRAALLRHAEAVRSIAHGLAQLREEGAAEPPDEPAAPAAAGVAERFLRVGALHIDTFRHTLSFQGDPVHVTPIEYALLCCLAEAQGRVLGYSEIVRRTHTCQVEDEEAQMLLKPHVRNIRRKIPPDYLVNVRGSGYMLVAP